MRAAGFGIGLAFTGKCRFHEDAKCGVGGGGMAWAVAAWATDPEGPAPVKVVHRGEKWQLLRADKPYFIRGGGGGGPKAMLARCGGNSFRTWGIGADTLRDLDEAQRCGLTVAVGCWLGHKDQGFRYDDPRAVERQAQDSAARC